MSSFFDRVRETASDLGNQAQRGIDQGQAKLDEIQIRRECDGLAKQIGYLVQRGRAQGVTDEAEIERLVGLLTAREAEIVTLRSRAAAPPQPAPTGWGQPPQQPSTPPEQPPTGWNQPPQPPMPPQAPQAPPPPLPPAPAWGGRPPAPGGRRSADELPEAPTWGSPPPEPPSGPGQPAG